MALQFHKVRSTMDAIVHNQNSNVVRMKLRQLKDQTLKDVHVLQVNTVVVPMVTAKRKVVTSMDAKIFRRHRKNRAVYRKMVVPVAISRSKTSSMWSTEPVLDSGTVDAAVTIIDSKQSKIVRAHVRKPKARVLVCYRKFMVHVPDIIRHSTTTRIGTCVRNSFTAVVWVTIIDLKRLKLARNCASSIELCVNIFFCIEIVRIVS